MKNVFVLFLVVLMAASCSTTKEVEEEVVETSSTPVKRQAPQVLNKDKRKSSIDAEQLAAQLGLEEDQEDLFIDMWNSTTEKMQKVRIDNRGDRDAMKSDMQAVKAERAEALERILTENQLNLYYEIMQNNRGRINGKERRRRG